MEFYMLMVQETGEYLPEDKMSYTKSELVAKDSGAPPRLFTDAPAAKRALTWWKKGKFGQESEWDELRGTYSYYGCDTNPAPVPERENQNVEVVRVNLLKMEPIKRLTSHKKTTISGRGDIYDILSADSKFSAGDFDIGEKIFMDGKEGLVTCIEGPFHDRFGIGFKENTK